MLRAYFVVLVIAVAVMGCTSEAPVESSSDSAPPTAEEPGTAPAESSSRTPQVGETAPDFTLTDHSGETVTLSDARGKPVVLAFYRGHW